MDIAKHIKSKRVEIYSAILKELNFTFHTNKFIRIITFMFEKDEDLIPELFRYLKYKEKQNNRVLHIDEFVECLL